MLLVNNSGSISITLLNIALVVGFVTFFNAMFLFQLMLDYFKDIFCYLSACVIVNNNTHK